MKYKFEYNGHSYEDDDFDKVADYIVNWVDENFNTFVEYTHHLVTKDNFDEYISNFIQDTIIEIP